MTVTHCNPRQYRFMGYCWIVEWDGSASVAMWYLNSNRMVKVVYVTDNLTHEVTWDYFETIRGGRFDPNVN